MNTTSTIDEDGLWETWRQPVYIVAFVIICLFIAIFVAVLTLIPCLSLYSIKTPRGRFKRRIGWLYHRESPELPTVSSLENGSWITFNNFSRSTINHRLPTRPPIAYISNASPRSQPALVWRPSMGSRLAWSFTSENDPTSPARYGSSNATTAEPPRTPLLDALRILKKLRSEP